MSCQCAPPSLEYCHWPVEPLDPLAVTATPEKAPADEPPGLEGLDWASAASEYWPASRLAKVWPVGLGVSSSIVAIASVPSPATVGASLLAEMLIGRAEPVSSLGPSPVRPGSMPLWPRSLVVTVSVSGPL